MHVGIKGLFQGMAAALLCAGLASPAYAQAPTLIGGFRDWFVYSTGAGASRTCYALSEPKISTPQGANRDPIFFLVSTFPSRKSVNEPSFVPGYPYKDASKASAQIGSDKFEFFTKNEGNAGGAWLDSPADERRLIEAMRKGSQMIVTGTSARGTLTRDTFSLAGVSAALDKVAQTCK